MGKTESILDTFYYNNRDNYKANKKITELIKNTIPKIYRYNHSSNYKFFYFFLIKNKSNEIAYDVILNGRILGICEIINHEKTIIEEFNNNVKLGDIRPKDEVIVKLWGGRISVTNVKNSFKISHTKGVSKIKVGGTVFGFSKWIFDNFIDLIFFIPMAILLIFALIIMIKPKINRYINLKINNYYNQIDPEPHSSIMSRLRKLL